MASDRQALASAIREVMTRDHLVVGRNYYRFCDHSRYVADWKKQASGGWWAEARYD